MEASPYSCPFSAVQKHCVWLLDKGTAAPTRYDLHIIYDSDRCLSNRSYRHRCLYVIHFGTAPRKDMQPVDKQSRILSGSRVGHNL